MALGLLALAITGALSACTPASEPASARAPVAVFPAPLATPGWAATGPLARPRYSHTETLLTTGQVLVVGGRANESEWLSSAELFDPSTGTWATTGALAQTRMGHTATRLSSGKVLVVGGVHYGDPRTYAQLYDPATGTWTAAGQLAEARRYHTATLLPTGRVLVAGGQGEAEPLASAELYDPETNTWAPAASMPWASLGHTATMLPGGSLLVVRGSASALYDTRTGAWRTSGSLARPHLFHTATLLPSGRVLVAAGVDTTTSTDVASAELYDPSTGTWSSAGSLATARASHTATLLPSGKVLVTGGGVERAPVASAELYDPATNTWSPTTGLVAARREHTATLLPSGRVLAVGGYASGGPLATAELYDPATGVWSSPASSQGRRQHTATVLPSGQVLVAGGYSDQFLATAELYDAATGTWASTGPLLQARRGHTATMLPSGQVLVVGGERDNSAGGWLATAERYDPATGLWRAATSRSIANDFHTATLLPSGKVLVVGGDGSTVSTPRLVTETYDPGTGSWAQGASAFLASDFHTATLLATGKVLVVAADSSLAEGTQARLYDPVTNTWGLAAAPQVPRYRHTATMLPTGKVLVAGGASSSGPTAVAEVYDPATNTWTATGPLHRGRQEHVATLLPTGKVLVAGGYDGTTSAGVEVYDPASGTWSVAAPLASARALHTATLLPTGGVLVTGGLGGGASFGPPEVYDETGAQSEWRPGVVGPANPLRAGSAFTLEGTRLMGIMGYDVPVVTLLDLGRETLLTLPLSFFAPTRLTATMPLVPSGQYLLFANADGMSSGTVVGVIRDEEGLDTLLGVTPPVLTRQTTATFLFSSNVEATFECRLDGASFASCTVPVLLSGLADGAHTFQVRARDALGTVDATPASYTWTVDTRPPDTRLVSGPPGTSRETTATFVFDSEVGATFECRLDGGLFVVCASPATYANFSVGSHTFQVRALDGAGNVDETPASHLWSIDLSPPAAPVITSPASGATLQGGRLTVTGTAPPRATVIIVLDGVEIGTTTADSAGSWSFAHASTLTEGQHTVSATARVEGVTSARSTQVSFSVDLPSDDTPSSSSEGCGCGAGPGDGAWMFAGLVLLAGVASRRQRRRLS